MYKSNSQLIKDYYKEFDPKLFKFSFSYLDEKIFNTKSMKTYSLDEFKLFSLNFSTNTNKIINSINNLNNLNKSDLARKKRDIKACTSLLKILSTTYTDSHKDIKNSLKVRISITTTTETESKQETNNILNSTTDNVDPFTYGFGFDSSNIQFVTIDDPINPFLIASNDLLNSINWSFEIISQINLI